MTRPARVVIDIAALKHNLNRIRSLAPNSKVMAIVKADAYGHGITRVATALDGADAFGVACLEEAQELRHAGITSRVLLLEGPYAADELKYISELGLDIVVHHEQQVHMLEKTSLASPLEVWLKIDSGMHRLGFQPGSVKQAWESLVANQNVANPPRLMTHFACANEPDNPMSQLQLDTFNNATEGLGAERSLANSAAILGLPQSHADWVRPGLMLYGVSPMPGCTSADHDLCPVMTLWSELISVKTVKKGEPVGYGADWHCPEDMLVGIVAAGYADGFPRHAGPGTQVLVNGQRCGIVGNTSMDMLAVDLRQAVDPSMGDEVELWGSRLPIEELATHAGTVPYEILTGVHKRLTFIES